MNVEKFLKSRMFTIIFTVISADPSPAKSWVRLYKNIFFRFMFILAIIYQTSENMIQSVLLTLSTICFFYIIGDKKEKEEYLSNNFKKEDLITLIYIIIFGIFLNKISNYTERIILK